MNDTDSMDHKVNMRTCRECGQVFFPPTYLDTEYCELHRWTMGLNEISDSGITIPDDGITIPSDELGWTTTYTLAGLTPMQFGEYEEYNFIYKNDFYVLYRELDNGYEWIETEELEDYKEGHYHFSPNLTVFIINALGTLDNK